VIGTFTSQSANQLIRFCPPRNVAAAIASARDRRAALDGQAREVGLAEGGTNLRVGEGTSCRVPKDTGGLSPDEEWRDNPTFRRLGYSLIPTGKREGYPHFRMSLRYSDLL
jgi:hypothetical protein